MWISPLTKSTSPHARPTNSPILIPVRSAQRRSPKRSRLCAQHVVAVVGHLPVLQVSEGTLRALEQRLHRRPTRYGRGMLNSLVRPHWVRTHSTGSTPAASTISALLNGVGRPCRATPLGLRVPTAGLGSPTAPPSILLDQAWGMSVEPSIARFRAVSAGAFLAGIVALDLFLNFFSAGFPLVIYLVVARRSSLVARRGA